MGYRLVAEYEFKDLTTYFGDEYTHTDGRECRWEAFEVTKGSGKTRTTVRAYGYWYTGPDDPPDTRRWCGRHDRQ